MADFRIPADHRVQLALPGHFHQVPAILGQGLIALFRILAGDPLAAPDLGQGLEDFLAVDAVLAEDLRAGGPGFLHQGQIQMFHGHIFVLELLGDPLRRRHKLGKPPAGVQLRAVAGHLGQAVDLPLNLPGQGFHVQTHVGQQPGNQSLPLAQQSQVQMVAVQLLLSIFDGNGLAVRYGLLCVLGVLIKIHVCASSGLVCPAGRTVLFSFHLL